MTGKQIAENLRNSKENWTKRALYRREKEAFCVLGLKAYEAGVSKNVLEGLAAISEAMAERGSVLWLKLKRAHPDINEIWQINDASITKEDCIAAFEAQGEREFPVEAFIDYLKAYYAPIEEES